ncbi:MAG: NADP-dependent oxidoreductase [Burkholderiales bacterium]|nr:NADP-dependent oxidoreductase [Burkholderiales bacterium]
MTTNMQILLASRPSGWVQESDFEMVKTPLPQAGPGQMLIRIHWLSLDPYMRGRMSSAKSYAKSVDIGEVMVGGAVGEVVASSGGKFAVGEFVVGPLGWQQYAVSNGEGLVRVDPDLVPLSAYLGVAGMPGATAWTGLLEHCRPRAGETVVVSAASGAVGSIVGQLAKMQGCRAVGIAGGKAKCDYTVQELGFDACVDYQAGRLYEDLRAACPDGIDCYFENVGGTVMDNVLRLLNPFSRIALCGMISDYNSVEPYGITNLRSLLVNRVRLQGFIVTDRLDLYARAVQQLAGWVAQGRLRYRETVAEGLENAPKAFIGMLKGANLGKQLVRVA